MISIYSPETICLNLERAGALEIVGCDSEVEEPAEEGEFLSIDPQTGFSYQVTAEGLEFVDADDPAGRLTQLLVDDSAYFPVYEIILRECLPSAGLGKKAIDALVDDHPLCKSPRLYSGHFLKKLENVDAIAFDGAWHTTEAGKDVMKMIADSTVA